jgi:hypothetical protein
MLMSIFVVSLVLWLVGVVTESMLGGFIHVLLLVAVAAAGLGIIQGRNRAVAAK